MRRCAASYAYDRYRRLCAACGMDSGSGSPKAADYYGSFQLSAYLDGNVGVICYLLSKGQLAETVPGNLFPRTVNQVTVCRYFRLLQEVGI